MHPERKPGGGFLEDKMQRAVKPLRTIVNPSFNLKNTFKVTEEAEEIKQEQGENAEDEFGTDDLVKYWKEFLLQLEEKNRIATFNALNHSEIRIIEGSEIGISFNSSSIEQEFDECSEEIILFLRKKLNNYKISIKTEVAKSEEKKFIKTDEDIFKEMVKENPILLKLKNDLGLRYNSDD